MLLKRARSPSPIRAEDDESPATTKCQRISESTEPCTICLSDSLSDAATLDCCAHTFCFSCIEQWTHDIASTCPLCKREVGSIRYREQQDRQVVVTAKRQQGVFHAELYGNPFAQQTYELLAIPHDDDDHDDDCSECDSVDSDASDWCWICERNMGHEDGTFIPCQGTCGETFHVSCIDPCGSNGDEDESEEERAAQLKDYVCRDCQPAVYAQRKSKCAHCERSFTAFGDNGRPIRSLPCPCNCGRYFHRDCAVSLTLFNEELGCNVREILPCGKCLELREGDPPSESIIALEAEQEDAEEAAAEATEDTRLDAEDEALLDSTTFLAAELATDIDAAEEPQFHDAADLIDDEDIDVVAPVVNDHAEEDDDDENDDDVSRASSPLPADPNEIYDQRLLKRLRCSSNDTEDSDVDEDDQDYPDADDSDGSDIDFDFDASNDDCY